MVTRSALETSVLERIRPQADERGHILKIAELLIHSVNRSGRATGMIVGSVARDTWIRGDRDLDIFMLFPPDLQREELETEGLALARTVAESAGGTCREKYAEHPYINATIDDLDVDIVPCYQVPDAAVIRSAVDRTPFHTRYIKGRISNLIDDVLLLKQFAKNGGIYGSDQMTEGFSGYLCELLVYHYGGFTPLLQAASDWWPGVLIDISDHRTKTFHEPLIVVDPVDPGRNVSASVSLTRMCEFIELCRGYLEKPGERFFSLPIPGPGSRETITTLFEKRKTSIYTLTFPTPPYIEEIVVPQLRKSLDAICALLARHEFVVNRSAYQMHKDRCMLLFELLTDSLPPVTRHFGPPLWARENARQFSLKYIAGMQEGRIFCGPYIENGMYVVEMARRYSNAGDLLMSPDLLEIGLGRHVREEIRGSLSVKCGLECLEDEFALFITTFLEKKSPLTQIRQEECGSQVR
ncbi:MAG: CCA tRNA nucleotidyltransferase [Methanomicrobiales archaeon]